MWMRIASPNWALYVSAPINCNALCGLISAPLTAPGPIVKFLHPMPMLVVLDQTPSASKGSN